jgi:hypothetical protein
MLMAQVAHVPVRQRTRHRVLAIGIPAFALAAGLGGAALAVNLPVTDPYSVHCFARAELDLFGNYPGTQAVVASTDPAGGPVSIDDAVGLCSDLWAQGLLASDWDPQTSQPDTTLSQPVPDDLTVCVMRDGTAAVIPGGDAVCSELGLATRSA